MDSNKGNAETNIRPGENFNTASGNSSGSTGKTETGRQAGRQTEKEVNPRNVVVELPTGDNQKKKKNRPTGMKYNKDKKKSNSSGKASQEMAILVNTFINGGFMIAANKFGSHWNLSPEESDNITQPAARIIAKYLDSEKLEQYSDGLALTIALGAAIIPRAILTASMKNHKKEDKKNVQTSGGFGQQVNPGSRVDNQPGNGKPASNAENVNTTNVKSILEDLSAANY